MGRREAECCWEKVSGTGTDTPLTHHDQRSRIGHPPTQREVMMKARYAGSTAFALTALGVLASGLPAQAATP